MISQLSTYGIGWWLIFTLIAFAAARLGGLRGILAGHLAIAMMVAAHDLLWIQAAMHRPGWNGQPDRDVVFTLGMFLRIVLINAFLLPVSALGWLSRRSTPPMTD